MAKHSKNNCAAPTFTYKERQMLVGIWGTSKARLGADSFKDFDACSLCLHPAVDPVVCPEGHLFCKGCIYESLLTQKDHKKKQLAKYQQQLEDAKDESSREAREAKLKEIAEFERLESGVLPTSANLFERKADIGSDKVPTGYEAYETPEGKVYIVDRELARAHSAPTEHLTKEQREARKKYLPCFWIPNLTPDAGPKKLLSAPSQSTACPAGQHALRVKQLRPVVLTSAGDLAVSATGGVTSKRTGERKVAPPAPKREATGGSAAGNGGGGGTTGSLESTKVSARWMCPSCRNGMTNSTKMACLRVCGHVLCMKCVKEFVAKDGQCAHCGADCRKKDVIEMKMGGTGFAATGAYVAKSLVSPAAHV